MQILEGNWIDLIIIIILAYFVLISFRAGFIAVLTDFVSFLLSLLFALRFYSFAGEFLKQNFSLSNALANALGFLSMAILAEIFLSIFFSFFYRKIPVKIFKHKLNKFLGVVPALGQAFVLIAFSLTLIMGLPLSPQIKEDVAGSKIGGYLVHKTTGLESRFNDIFGGIIQDTLTYLTVRPESDQIVALTVNKIDLQVDEQSEQAMFRLVNQERESRGVSPLLWRAEALSAARGHATDMWERKYFGHISPEGKSVSNRLEEDEVGFMLAGENLALAPTLDTAHTGLMNSTSHRENILDPKFKQIAIGVIDNGVYGKMFVQIFTD